MDIGIIGILIFAVLIVLIFAGLPIAFAIGLTALVGIWVFIGPDAMSQLATLSFKYASDPTFALVPLFVIMAELLSKSGVAEQAFDAANKWFGKVRGGLGVSTQVAGALFGACCGSSSGGTATIGLAAMPQLRKHKYESGFAAGMIASAGGLSILIPPSAILILYGILTEASIGKLFIAGILPGVVVLVLYSTYVLIHAKVRPQDAEPEMVNVTWGERFASLKNVWAFILIGLGVLGSIYAGICTALESASVGAFLSLVVAGVYRKLTWQNVTEAMLSAAKMSCFIFFILLAAFTFSYLINYLGIPMMLAEGIMASGMGATGFVLLSLGVFVVLGCLLDPAGIIVLTVPTLLPVMTALNVDFIWFGVILVLAMMIGNITPPVGINLFVVKNIAPDIPMTSIMRGTAPYVLLLLVAIALVFFFPAIATVLPNMM